jgi:hypothetical protein
VEEQQLAGAAHRQRGRDRAAAVTPEQASEERKRKTAVAQRARAGPVKRREEAEDGKLRTRIRRSCEAIPYHTDGTVLTNAVHACLCGSQLANAHRLNTLSKDSRKHELAIQDIIANIKLFALITDEDPARMAWPSTRPSTSRPSWPAAPAAGPIPTSSTSRCVSTTCQRGPRPTTSSRIKSLSTFELLKTLADGTLEAVTVHRRDVHHVCQPDSLRHRGRPRVLLMRTPSILQIRS